MSFHIDRLLFGADSATNKLRVFDHKAFVAALQVVEAALTRTETDADLTPESAAEWITETGRRCTP